MMQQLARLKGLCPAKQVVSNQIQSWILCGCMGVCTAVVQEKGSPRLEGHIQVIAEHLRTND
jgi:hypothetical protein